jgi:hypothetical protein
MKDRSPTRKFEASIYGRNRRPKGAMDAMHAIAMGAMDAMYSTVGPTAAQGSDEGSQPHPEV